VTAIGGWAGTGVGLILIGACVVASWFVHHAPASARPWVDRLLIVGMYCGTAALLVTTIGLRALRLLRDLLGLFGGTGAGLGKAAVYIAAVFLLLTVLVAVIKTPDFSAAMYAVALVFVLALVPGGFLHGVYAATAVPGQQAAGWFAAWLGG
jgi:hypothetical protein